jgi:hypothetical protein
MTAALRPNAGLEVRPGKRLDLVRGRRLAIPCRDARLRPELTAEGPVRSVRETELLGVRGEVVARWDRCRHAGPAEHERDLVTWPDDHVARIAREELSVHIHAQRAHRPSAVRAKALVGESHTPDIEERAKRGQLRYAGVGVKDTVGSMGVDGCHRVPRGLDVLFPGVHWSHDADTGRNQHRLAVHKHIEMGVDVLGRREIVGNRSSGCVPRPGMNRMRESAARSTSSAQISESTA